MSPAAYSTPIPRPFSLIGEQVSFITTRLDSHGPTASVFQMNDCIAFRTGIVTVTLHCPLFTDERNLSPVHEADGHPENVSNVSPYLIDADNVFIESRNKPICEIPEIGIGCQIIDGGNFLFDKEGKDAFIAKEPESAPFFHQIYGSEEFINRKPRYCLWLGNCSPAQLRKMPECLHRVENVKIFRSSSKRSATVKLAEKPTHFGTENMPTSDYIVIPKVSSERRRYVPMGILSSDDFCTDLVFLIPNTNLFHFGVLTSNVHMAWMRAVCGRLKSDYRYSKDIVYNNFPWPTPSDSQKAKIEQTAQTILDARAKYPDCSLADLYDELTMPVELRKAHQENDKAVMEAYGFNWRTMTESDCVAELFKLYQRLTK